LTQSLDNFIEENYNSMEQISKRVLKSRWREGISSYYIYLYDKMKIPTNFHTNFYYFMINLSKPQSEINYVPVVLRSSCDDDKDNTSIIKENIADSVDLEATLMMQMDLEDEILIDFITNNHNNQKWIKIYEIFYEKKIELDLFEEVIFDYIFKQGLSIREIAKLTNNSPSWIYRYRKSLLDKIKAVLNESAERKKM
jgi:hypothetical protein